MLNEIKIKIELKPMLNKGLSGFKWKTINTKQIL